ncbi:MAG: protease complex subunit PrcB family protein [Deltaproteobacteria bacterium]|nr:protease complex subunit PrcB family protein [Deltaproteobacteria bacterium]
MKQPAAPMPAVFRPEAEESPATLAEVKKLDAPPARPEGLVEGKDAGAKFRGEPDERTKEERLRDDGPWPLGGEGGKRETADTVLSMGARSGAGRSEEPRLGALRSVRPAPEPRYEASAETFDLDGVTVVGTGTALGGYHGVAEGGVPYIVGDIADEADKKRKDAAAKSAPAKPAAPPVALGAASSRAARPSEEREAESSADDESGAEVRIVERVEGVYSGFRRETRRLITTPAEFAALWKTVWANRIDPPPAPAIDFSRQVVLVVALGSLATGGHRVTIRSVERQGDKLIARVTRTQPQPGSAVTEAMSQPYSLVVVDVGGPVPSGLSASFAP